MTKRIFQSICIAVVSVFLASVLLFMGVLYEYFSRIQYSQLEMQTKLATQGVTNEGAGYFEGLDVKDYRITWIAADGTVLYDSKSDSAGMENHLEREEIRQAFADGMGESSRYSVTLMERSLYCAQRLPDGTVLRLSIAQNTLLTLLLGMFQPICIIFAIAMGLSMILAFRLSRGIVEPLNELNLDEPLSNEGYDELAPLLQRIATQQRQIRQQRDELRQKQSEFETVTTGMAEGIVLLNEKKIILGINPAAVRLFGTDGSCVGKYILSVNRSLELQELLQKAGDGRHAEMVLELGSGKYQLDASPVFSDGLVSGVVLLMLDVTEKEKSEQMRREFTANVSHELKTPLHTISGYAELLAGGMVKPEDVEGFSARIYAEARRMIRLVEDIIRLSHLDEGADDMKREEVDLHMLAMETIQALLPEAEAAGVQLDLCDVPGIVRTDVCGASNVVRTDVCGASDVVRTDVCGAPDVVRADVCGASDVVRTDVCGASDVIQTDAQVVPCGLPDAVQVLPRGETGGARPEQYEGSATVYGIRQLLSAMLYNMCDNAIKYNRGGGSVSVMIRSEEDGIRLSVSDTGIGIPEEHQERIFERFYRVDKSHSKEIGGTGLGLSIVKHGAKLHDAAIEVHSIVGSGTTITLLFPRFHNREQSSCKRLG